MMCVCLDVWDSDKCCVFFWMCGVHIKFRFYQVISAVHVKFRVYQDFSGVHVKFKFYQVFSEIHLKFRFYHIVVGLM